MNSSAHDYAVKVSVRNGRILRRMRLRGIETQVELAELAGVSIGAINDLITMREAGYNKKGEWRDVAYRIADALMCDPHDLFNDQQREAALQRSSAEVYMSAPQVAAIMDGDSEKSSWAKLEVQRLLDSVSDREKRIIGLRMDGLTYEEAAEVEGVTRERIRQIEMKGHRKMRAAAARSEADCKSKLMFGAEVNGLESR